MSLFKIYRFALFSIAALSLTLISAQLGYAGEGEHMEQMGHMGGMEKGVSAKSAPAELKVPEDHPTIQGAIDKAKEGDTVIVSDGLYKENIVIKAPIVLRSKNGSLKTFIEPVEPKKDVIKIENSAPSSRTVAISGFTIRGSQAAGLHIIKSPRAKIFRNDFTGNDYGLQVEHSNNTIIKENTFNANDTGLYLYFSDECLLEDNEASNNTNAGILLHSSHRNIIRENVTSRNVWNGITLSSSNDNEVKDNSSLKNTYAIVISESSGNILDGNSTMPRLYYILPVALVYLSIMFYIIERKLFILYYHYKHGE
jgi:parallel beta-helix repeat protein